MAASDAVAGLGIDVSAHVGPRAAARAARPRSAAGPSSCRCCRSGRRCCSSARRRARSRTSCSGSAPSWARWPSSSASRPWAASCAGRASTPGSGWRRCGSAWWCWRRSSPTSCPWPRRANASKALSEPILERPDLFSGHPLGTDRQGLDILGGVIYGARISLEVSLGAVAIGLAIGGIVGVMAGFFRGRIDFAASLVADSVLAFPPLILLLAVVAAVRPNARNIALRARRHHDPHPHPAGARQHALAGPAGVRAVGPGDGGHEPPDRAARAGAERGAARSCRTGSSSWPC